MALNNKKQASQNAQTNQKHKSSKVDARQDAEIAELTTDLQRLRADFENYRKRVDVEKQQARDSGKTVTVMQLLPVIDTIERAIAHRPADLEGNKWAEGVMSITKQLTKQLESIGVKRIDAKPGQAFNPDIHEAVQFDEDSEGDKEVIAEELQAGYLIDGNPVRPAMVKVTRK